MESDEDTFDNDNVDSGNVSSGDDDFAMEVDITNSKDRQTEPEEYQYEVLTTDYERMLSQITSACYLTV